MTCHRFRTGRLVAPLSCNCFKLTVAATSRDRGKRRQVAALQGVNLSAANFDVCSTQDLSLQSFALSHLNFSQHTPANNKPTILLCYQSHARQVSRSHTQRSELTCHRISWLNCWRPQRSSSSSSSVPRRKSFSIPGGMDRCGNIRVAAGGKTVPR